MLKFDNTHIFSGYLKQLLSNFNLPTCRVYTKEFAEYLANNGKEDPRVIESFDTIEYFYSTQARVSKERIGTRVNYLKGNELYNYFWKYDQSKPKLNHSNCSWQLSTDIFYNPDSKIAGLTKSLKSAGIMYDTSTHEYLGDYLRFIRDYYSINLMSLYNCFNNKLCNNLYYKHIIKSTGKANAEYRVFNSQDSKYHIYALPVKLFANYTIAIDSAQGVEMFCGFYKTALDTSSKSVDLINKTYTKIKRC